ncbi:MAG: ATP-binding protein [Sulfuricurvum sp.]|uniref:ATP-binding protein n=1 Tax=Sulfuricurvum sp. TaxID=2025608 RepID=UPI00260DBC63|nr:ATP-binding protein [Sulfuricurvum sp.]MDD2367753.1 ATP-binding protein [Sulfuricurvum sp.]MDD5117333.1 ATP-binding protein [Sulfuricurvum sp.]
MANVKFNVGDNAVIQLGENLYKNIYGVLIEYITNSYDADASIVEIKIDRTKRLIMISDDGTGMTHAELHSVFLDVGLNRRRQLNLTPKRRLVTGRKGFGKLACFGLFESFIVETVKNNLFSKLEITTGENEFGEFNYTANINDKAKKVNQENGTKIYLINNTQEITDNKSLAESIAKRINLMYDANQFDRDGFKIKLEDITIDKTYRNSIVLNTDIKFKYNIPEDLKRFTKDKELIKYIEENKINGVVIAREKTVRIKENKGIVLFARGKLCQEATYLDINPSNNYGYAHLYGEFNVDFIDNESKDNIGTDRTALKETETTLKLFEVIESLMKAYARLYDEDERARKENAIEEFKGDDKYKVITKTIESIKDLSLRKELFKLFQIKIKNSVTENIIDVEDIENFEKVANSIMSYNLQSEQISKDESKDNVITSYDYLIAYLRNKYTYTGNDGVDIMNFLYGQNNQNVEYSALSLRTTHTVKDDIKKSMRELGNAIVNLRNSMMHTNDRECINTNISIENSKRFLVMVDLFIELDILFFIPIPIP